MSAVLQWLAELSTTQKVVGAGALTLAVYLTRPAPKPKSDDAAVGKDGKRKRNIYGELMGRLKQIFRIIFPKLVSREMLHLLGLSALLIGRTVISIRVAESTGKVAGHLVQAQWEQFVSSVMSFAALGIPAAFVNSFLKYETSMLSLCFRDRLTRHLNDRYVSGVNFYKATNLPQSLIENIDQRVTIDIERFCEDLANLYTSLFKPILDIVLNAARLSRVMGARGPVIIAGYYLVLGQVKMRLMPDFKKLTMLQSELEGDYRTAHSRLITNSEEISFFDGAAREKSILTGMFDKLYKHIAAFSEKKAWIGVIDQYLIKYGSSVVGYALMALPIFFPVGGDTSNRTVGDNTRDFVRNRQLLMDLAGAIGTLLQTVNKVATLAGSTSRVGEVLDSVNDIRNNGSAPFVVRTDAPITTAVSPSSPVAADDEKNRDKAALAAAHASQEAFLVAWRDLGDKLRASRLQAAREQQHSTDGELVTVKNGGGLMAVGETIEFRDASIVSPDGRLLVEHLSVSVPRGVNVMVTGPNGCGKSSLFRILGELWPLHSGLMIKPGKEDIMFVPQKPYQVIGTLRDQLIYPHSVAQMKALGVSDEDLINLLRVVDPASGILSQWNLDETRNWINAFSGGQKQRVAMARVFYHRPRYAILDECTSAVSDEVESIIYTTCRKLGITIFTVSHRAQLQQYHDQQLRYDGRGGWEFLDSESVAKRQKEAALSA